MKNVFRGGVAVIDTDDAMGLAMYASMMEMAARKSGRAIALAYFTALERHRVTATYYDLRTRGLEEEAIELVERCIELGPANEREALRVHTDEYRESRGEAAWARAELDAKPESVKAEVAAQCVSDRGRYDA